jgi:predicted nucleotide-binding protein
MRKNIAEHLHQFALSVDMVDSETFYRIKAMLSEYFTKKLKADFYEIQIDGTEIRSGDTSKNALKTIWTNGKETTTEIYKDDGSYSGQTIYSYDKVIPLWITSKNKMLLRDAINNGGYIDLWSHSEDLPRYWDYAQIGAKTSIVIPLKYGSRTFGFINLEFKDYIEYSNLAKDELSYLSSAIARIIWLQEIHKNQISDTKTAVDALQTIASSQQSFVTKPTIPRIFLASSSRADANVISKIIEVLDRYNNKFVIVFWKLISESGDINEKLASAIESCDLGICYLSEPNDSNDSMYKYKDNSNVLFEAGMFHSLCNLDKTKFWIPIREKSSPRAPFDFLTQRTIVINRLADDTLIEEGLEGQLVRMVENFLQS